MIALVVRGAAARALPGPARRRLAARMTRAMVAAGVGDREATLALVPDEEVRALNARFAGDDHATDVLSFSQAAGEAPDPPPGAPALLGDIVVAIETAARQAAGRDVPLADELLHLAVHGLAHLCGLDHATADEERRMFAWEARLREQAVGRGRVRPAPRP